MSTGTSLEVKLVRSWNFPVSFPYEAVYFSDLEQLATSFLATDLLLSWRVFCLNSWTQCSANNRFQCDTLTWKNFEIFGTTKQIILKKIQFQLTFLTSDCFNEGRTIFGNENFLQWVMSDLLQWVRSEFCNKQRIVFYNEQLLQRVASKFLQRKTFAVSNKQVLKPVTSDFCNEQLLQQVTSKLCNKKGLIFAASNFCNELRANFATRSKEILQQPRSDFTTSNKQHCKSLASSTNYKTFLCLETLLNFS